VEANVLTVLAILVAGYTLLAEEKRIDLKLRLTLIDIFVILLLVAILLYVIYLPVLNTIGLALPSPWLWGFNENLTVFTSIVTILIYLMVKLAGRHLPKSKFQAWTTVSEKLLRSQKFEVLGFLLEKYHTQFIESHDDRWYDKIRSKLLTPYQISPLDFLDKDDSKKSVDTFLSKVKMWITDRLKPIAFLLSKILPDDSSSRYESSKSLSNLLKSKQFVKYLTHTRPLLCANFTTTRFDASNEFTTSFLKELIANTSSPLYRELRYNQSCSYTGEYYLDESNQLLNFYFTDIKVASDVSVWKPVGDYSKEFISKQKGKDNFYNKPYLYTYDDEEKWNCPIYMSLHFFNIMVSRAIFTRHYYHMWLMYVERIIEGILKNYEPHPDADQDLEYPTRFDYLLYEALDTCVSWVGAVEHMPTHKIKSKEVIRRSPEYWAARTLGNILKKIVKTDKLTEKQCVYYLEKIIRLLNDLDSSDNQFFSKVIIEYAVKENEFSKPDMTVITSLSNYYRSIDGELMNKNSTFEKELLLITGNTLRPAMRSTEIQ